MLWAIVEWELGSWITPGKGASTKRYVKTFTHRKEAFSYMKKHPLKNTPAPARLQYVVRCS